MKIDNRKAQNVLEYTMLIIIAAAALVAMTTYVMRAMNARLIQAQDELDYYRLQDTASPKSGG
jgi:hypothetical protein